MDTNDIVLAIDAEISRLRQAKALLSDTSSLTHAVGLQPSPRFLALRYDRLPSSPAPVKIASEETHKKTFVVSPAPTPHTIRRRG
jgi:hypothetical protein